MLSCGDSGLASLALQGVCYMCQALGNNQRGGMSTAKEEDEHLHYDGGYAVCLKLMLSTCLRSLKNGLAKRERLQCEVIATHERPHLDQMLG